MEGNARLYLIQCSAMRTQPPLVSALHLSWGEACTPPPSSNTVAAQRDKLKIYLHQCRTFCSFDSACLFQCCGAALHCRQTSYTLNRAPCEPGTRHGGAMPHAREKHAVLFPETNNLCCNTYIAFFGTSTPHDALLTVLEMCAAFHQSMQRGWISVQRLSAKQQQVT